MKYLSIKSVLFYLVFFLILYFENLSIGGVRLSQIWKLPFYFYAIHFVLKKMDHTNKKVMMLFFIGIFMSLKIIFNAYFNYGFLENIAESFYFLTLPISIAFFYYKYKRQPGQLHYLLITLSFFLVISNIPFVLNLLPQKNNTFSLERFGLIDKFALNGLFYHTSITSKILVVSLLILLTTYKDKISNKFEKLLILSAIIFGMYSLYLCYTRTGWLLLLIGIIILFVYKENVGKLFFKILPLFFIVGFVLISYVQSNETLQLRLRGGTTYRQNKEIDASILTSYRLDLYEHAINNLYKDGFGTILLGSGKKKATEDMGEIMGTDFVAHNRFIELFQYGGFLALILFFIFIRTLYSLIKTIPKVKGVYRSKLPLTLFVVYFLALIPSHGFPIWADVLFGITIAIGLNTKQINQLKNQQT
jgi:hypothetical protein